MVFRVPMCHKDTTVSWSFFLNLGVGVEHELLVELAKQSFGKNPIWLENAASVQKPIERDSSVAQYTGGTMEVCFTSPKTILFSTFVRVEQWAC